MYIEKVTSKDLKSGDHISLMDFSDDILSNDILFVRDIQNEEAEINDFYLILSGKYAKKMRQLFSSFESELMELN